MFFVFFSRPLCKRGCGIASSDFVVDRFPDDFRFQLTREEFARLKSQIVTSKAQPIEANLVAPNRSQIATGSERHRDPRFRPFAFTEHGALMAATVLNSPRAMQMSLFIVRAFVRMREELATNAIILRRLAEIDKQLLTHDVVLRDIYEKLAPLLAPPDDAPKRRIGFHQGNH
jgi:hypothetical protein